MPINKITTIKIFLGILLWTKISFAKLYIIGARINNAKYPIA
jgi:hypothetical protein